MILSLLYHGLKLVLDLSNLYPITLPVCIIIYHKHVLNLFQLLHGLFYYNTLSILVVILTWE